jgi:NTE family protein
MSLFQLYISSSLQKIFFSSEKKGASKVALFFQEKINFLPSRLFISIWGFNFVIQSQLNRSQNPQFRTRNLVCYSAFFLFAFFFLSHTSFAQEQKRPKIGLVLSGGGAKGFAHIGVLKVLEEAGVKIDYIGGTSMGAVIGGLYASGYNAAQIDSIFQATDFSKLLSDYIPRSSKSFYEKRNEELYALVLPFSNLKLGIPQALSKGMYNYNLLSRITRNVNDTKEFSKLPIPFLCIATNIETGEEVLLDKGNLAQAMIASSAFPSLFSPVEIDGKILVDGGVVNNYPIEEVRKLGADIIIGVDVQNDLLDRDQLKDATKILVQITNLQSMERMKRNIKNTDIYIKPDITQYGVISFDKGKEIITKGEEATFAVFEQIKKLVDESNPYKKPKLIINTDSLYIKSINTNDLANYTSEYVNSKLRFKPKSKISYNDLLTGIDNINGTQNFRAISYSLENNDDGVDLNLDLKENSTKTFLKFGLHYDNLFKSGVLVNLTRKKTLFKNDLASLDIILGDNFRYNFDYYIENGFNLSLGFKSNFNQFNRNITSEISTTAPVNPNVSTLNVDFSDLTNQIYFQSIFVQKFLIGGGLELKYLKIKSETLANVDQYLDRSNYLSVFSYVKFDSFDSRYFPKKGWYFAGDIQSYLLSSNYTNNFQPFSIAKADFGVAATLFKNATIKFETDAGFSFGQESVPFFNFILGGFGYNPINNFKYFYGYDFLSLTGNSYIKSTTTFDYEIFKNNHVNFSANFANIGNRIFETIDWISIPEYSGYAVGYGLETPIGPVEIKYSWSPEQPKGFTWFSIGFIF